MMRWQWIHWCSVFVASVFCVLITLIFLWTVESLEIFTESSLEVKQTVIKRRADYLCYLKTDNRCCFYFMRLHKNCFSRLPAHVNVFFCWLSAEDCEISSYKRPSGLFLLKQDYKLWSSHYTWFFSWCFLFLAGFLCSFLSFSPIFLKYVQTAQAAVVRLLFMLHMKRPLKHPTACVHAN